MNEHPYHLLVEETKDYAMFLMDKDRRVYYWNSGAELIFGYSKEEMTGEIADKIFTPEDCAAGIPLKEAEVARVDGRANDVRWHLRKDNSRFWANGIMTCLRDETGAIKGFAKIARDATKDWEADEALRKAHDELEQRVALRTDELQRANTKLKAEGERRRLLEEARHRLLERVVSSQEEERRRIARELHDQMGQQLAGLLMGLKAINSDLTSKPADVINARINILETALSELIEQAHDLAWELRPPTLDTFGLEEAIRKYAQDWADKNGVRMDFVVQGMKGPRPSQRIETTFYRVVQEALTNVQRHASAQNVSIVLEQVHEEIVMVVEDDGVGFEFASADGEPTGSSKRIGLLGMQERMELIGGTFTVESKPGRGTVLYARAPAT